ncbi:MAG: glycosyltransferase family 2 protein [Selenomonadaceae bacterium]|nr:glycosyltransferase family 2 protein [Selenomonadaceae bacterium]
MKKTIPAISIIIPMYNTEKYIGECLDSILAQTFDDYEVIVVDDCSTDNSCALVESYLPKFNQYVKGRVDKLQLIRSEKNSGGCPGIPTNIGIRISNGEYIMFIDSDDMITPTALEELYQIVKIYDADFLTGWDYYTTVDEVIPKDIQSIKKHSDEALNPFKMPVRITENLAERVNLFYRGIFIPMTCNIFVRRKFIAKHGIVFPNLMTTQDSVFFLSCLCLAKTIVCMPNAFYIWRTRSDSSSRKVMSHEKTVHMRGGTIFKQIKVLDDFMNKFEFFQQNINYKYAVFDVFVRSWTIGPLLEIYTKVPAWELDNFIRRELEGIEDKVALTAFLFSRMNVFNVQLNQQGAIINQMKAYIQQQSQIIQQLQARIAELQK